MTAMPPIAVLAGGLAKRIVAADGGRRRFSKSVANHLSRISYGSLLGKASQMSSSWSVIAGSR
jgi:hypothetical protein